MQHPDVTLTQKPCILIWENKGNSGLLSLGQLLLGEISLKGTTMSSISISISITLASVFPTLLDMLRFRDNCGAGIRFCETFLV